MKTLKRLLSVFFCLTVLPGCAPFIKSQVTVFHEFPQGFSGTTYVLVPSKDQEGDLEYKSYEQAVRQRLNTNGFREAPIGQAELAVFISYGIDNGREVVSSFPVYGQTGVSSSTTYGNVQSYGNSATYSGTTTYTPAYGVVGSEVQSSTVYSRSRKIQCCTLIRALK